MSMSKPYKVFRHNMVRTFKIGNIEFGFIVVYRMERVWCSRFHFIQLLKKPNHSKVNVMRRKKATHNTFFL